MFSLHRHAARGEIHLSDINAELINAYQVVRSDVENLIRHLRRHENTAEYFYRIRDWDRSSGYARRTALSRASRFLYLNKTAYNGLYRVNSRGEFNVPFGRYRNPQIIDADNLRRCSRFLQRVNLSLVDSFEETAERIGRADFVYLDPPYEPVSDTSSFTSYTSSCFDELEQVKLFQFCRRLSRRGTYFMLSNSSAPWIVELYRKEKAFHVEKIPAGRAINCKAERRGKVWEIIVRNYR